jgi:lipid-binding SYLF domain-containing protein
VSLDGSVIFSRDNVNFHFYGRRITPQEILSGSVQPPRAAQPLYDALAHAFIAAPSNFT